MISILLADSHEIIRESLAALLCRVPGFRICGQCANSYQLIRNVELLTPNVALIDESMRGTTIAEAARSIRQISPLTQIIVLTFYREGGAAVAKSADIYGCVTKRSTKKDLIQAIKSAAGEKLFWLDNFSRMSGQVPLAAAVLNGSHGLRNGMLTRREVEVLRLIGEGNSSRQIAARLGISQTTVKTHRNNLMEKLEVKNVAGLTRESIRLKLVALE